MAKKIVLDAEQFTVPLNKLAPSPENVRKTYAPEEIEEMAASIAVKDRGLLQNLGVTEQVDEAGEPTGVWEVVAGGRRYRGLMLLVERKRLSATAPIPCRKVARELAVDASLEENEQRRALHPADAYEAYASLHRNGKGLGVEEIAARHGVSPYTVRQRLRLGTVAPVLLAAYRQGKLTLDHVMAFTVTEDRAAQERAYEELPDWQRTPAAIRRVLTQASVPAYDPRVRLVGLDAYRAAGGRVQRDLFTEDGGGWLTDTALLERLVGERVREVADRVRAEGWKWVETDHASVRSAWGTTRRVWPEKTALSEDDEKRRDELAARFDELASEHPNGAADAAEEVRAELEAIERELDALEGRERAFRPEDVARAGATIHLTNGGALAVERGFVRREDEPRPEPEPEADGETDAGGAEGGDGEDARDAEEDVERGEEAESENEHIAHAGGGPAASPAEPKTPALTADLDAELSAHRTAALRAEIMRQPDLGLRVLAHGLATATFYGGYPPTVARIAPPYGGIYGMGGATGDSPARRAIKAAEDEQKAVLPTSHTELWEWLQAQDVPVIHALLAVCIGRVADAQGGDWTDAGGARHVCARAARDAGLDMRRWWSATRASYLGRVTKAGILAAVREGAGDDAARRIEDMKKDAMAENAEALLAGKGWLPHRLRVPVAQVPTPEPVPGEAEDAGAATVGEGFEHPLAAE